MLTYPDALGWFWAGSMGPQSGGLRGERIARGKGLNLG
jgi:hypothetical protein